MTDAMTAQIRSRAGFVAALDQSGGSTPDALRQYGVPDSAYRSEAEMFALMHAMRLRVMQSPAFRGDKVIGTILFEQAMDGQVEGTPVPAFLWETRRVVPFLKVDKGREEEADGVKLMKPIPGLDDLLKRARRLGVFGTKMRSVVRLPSRSGIAAVLSQQFELAARIARHGLVPIIEPEVLLDSPDRQATEAILLSELERELGRLTAGQLVMLKLSIPVVPDFFRALAGHRNVLCLLALSGGYGQDEACERLAGNHDMVGSFSRALLEKLRVSMPDAEFDAALGEAIDKISQASTTKH